MPRCLTDADTLHHHHQSPLVVSLRIPPATATLPWNSKTVPVTPSSKSDANYKKQQAERVHCTYNPLPKKND